MTTEKQPAFGEWQPIAAAPANTRLLVWGNGPIRFGVKDQHGQWRAKHGGPLRNPPKKWMPEPAPPKEEVEP